MTLHLRPLPPATPVPLMSPTGPCTIDAAMRLNIDNMVATLADCYGVNEARNMVTQAFLDAWAEWAEEGGKPVPSRFALEVAIEAAQIRARLPAFDIHAMPDGAA